LATYKTIQAEAKRQLGFVPKTCWIAAIKAELGFISRAVANRIDPNNRKYPCPPAKRPALTRIVATLREAES
jgi:hypothetical protein